MHVTVAGADRALADRLDEEIDAFNAEATGMTDGRMLTARVADGDRLLAGLSGWTWGACGYVDVLWVTASHRGQGLGTQVMDAVEAEMVARGCRQVVLSSHSFQAPVFYERRGYRRLCEVEGYPAGFSLVVMAKALPPRASPGRRPPPGLGYPGGTSARVPAAPSSTRDRLPLADDRAYPEDLS